MEKYEDKLRNSSRRMIYSSDKENDQDEPPLLQVPASISNESPKRETEDLCALSPPLLPPAPPEQSLANSDPVLATDVENSTESISPESDEIDPELLLALGDFVPEATEWGEDINNNVAKRWELILKEGLKKETREELLKKYLLPNNCSLTKPPLLIPEVDAVLTEGSRNRDSRLTIKQGQLGAVLSVIGKVITGMLKKSMESPEALRLLSDATKLIADSHYAETETRRALVTPLLEKSFVDSFKDRKRDSYLFGDKLGEFIKSSTGIKKTGRIIQAVSNS